MIFSSPRTRRARIRPGTGDRRRRTPHGPRRGNPTPTRRYPRRYPPRYPHVRDVRFGPRGTAGRAAPPGPGRRAPRARRRAVVGSMRTGVRDGALRSVSHRARHDSPPARHQTTRGDRQRVRNRIHDDGRGRRRRTLPTREPRSSRVRAAKAEATKATRIAAHSTAPVAVASAARRFAERRSPRRRTKRTSCGRRRRRRRSSPPPPRAPSRRRTRTPPGGARATRPGTRRVARRRRRKLTIRIPSPRRFRFRRTRASRVVRTATAAPRWSSCPLRRRPRGGSWRSATPSRADGSPARLSNTSTRVGTDAVCAPRTFAETA